MERARYNPEQRAEWHKGYYEANRETRLEQERQRYEREAERIQAAAAKYRAENRDKVYEWNGTRRAALRRALPSWCDRAQVRAVYREARRLTLETGIRHHVDHIVPLSHADVCGLHVPNNLQVLTATENLKKSNRL